MYVNSPCNFTLYFTHPLVYCGLVSCACCVEQRLAFALQKVGKGRLTLKEEQLSAIRSAYDQEDAFAWLLTGFGKSIEYLFIQS